MSCHGMSAWVVFGLATLPFLTMRVLQVRFHDDIDGSSLARAIYASTGPLLLPFDSGFSTHTHTCSETSLQISVVECISRAKNISVKPDRKNWLIQCEIQCEEYFLRPCSKVQKVLMQLIQIAKTVYTVVWF